MILRCVQARAALEVFPSDRFSREYRMWMHLVALGPFKLTFPWSMVAFGVGVWAVEAGAPAQGMLLGLAAVLAALVPYANLYYKDREGQRDNQRLRASLERLVKRYDAEISALNKKYDE